MRTNRALAIALLLGLTVSQVSLAEESKSITGFGKQLGSDHFLEVGVRGGYGWYPVVIAGTGGHFGFEAGVTFLNHIEIKPGFDIHYASILGVAIGSWTFLTADILYRVRTGGGFYVGPTIGLMTYSAPATLPSGYTFSQFPTAGSTFTFGGKIGHDFTITDFLSIGVESRYFAGFLDAVVKVNFWF